MLTKRGQVMRVFSYERCSLDEQTNSIDTQHQLIKKYCHLKDFELTGSFVDFVVVLRKELNIKKWLIW